MNVNTVMEEGTNFFARNLDGRKGSMPAPFFHVRPDRQLSDRKPGYRHKAALRCFKRSKGEEVPGYAGRVLGCRVQAETTSQELRRSHINALSAAGCSWFSLCC